MIPDFRGAGLQADPKTALQYSAAGIGAVAAIDPFRGEFAAGVGPAGIHLLHFNLFQGQSDGFPAGQEFLGNNLADAVVLADHGVAQSCGQRPGNGRGTGVTK